ncbi:RND transporter [Actibacterium sp. D379-3]
MLRFIDALPLPLLLVLVATLGLAPYVPEPHIWEKLTLLAAGDLSAPIDLFDFLLHGAPWLFLAAKLTRGDRAG